MDSFVLILIVATAVCIKAHEQEIEVYEIRKAKDDLEDYHEHDNGEIRISDDYYDPNGLDRHHHTAVNLDAPNKDRSVDIITNSLIDKLRKLIKFRNHNRKDRRDDDDIASYRAMKDGDIFDDNNKSPLVIFADESILYHLTPKKPRHRNKLDSALRSIDYDTEVEDRTAPPRVRIRYDYDY